MAKLEYLIPIGLLKKSKKFIPGHFEFKKIIADILKGFNIPFQDECCEPLNNGAPVRYNPTLQRLEWHDGSDWVDISGIAETTTTSTTTTSSTTTTTTVA